MSCVKSSNSEETNVTHRFAGSGLSLAVSRLAGWFQTQLQYVRSLSVRSIVTQVECKGSNHAALGCVWLNFFSSFFVFLSYLSLLYLSFFPIAFCYYFFHFSVCIFFSLFCLFTMFSFISLCFLFFSLSFIFLCSFFYCSSHFSNSTYLFPGERSCKTIDRCTQWRSWLRHWAISGRSLVRWDHLDFSLT